MHIYVIFKRRSIISTYIDVMELMLLLESGSSKKLIFLKIEHSEKNYKITNSKTR